MLFSCSFANNGAIILLKVLGKAILISILTSNYYLVFITLCISLNFFNYLFHYSLGEKKNLQKIKPLRHLSILVSVSQMVKLKPGDEILIICLRCCRWPVAEPGFTPGLLAAQLRFSTTHLTAPASRQLTLRTQSTPNG